MDKNTDKKTNEWREAQRCCCLSDEDIRMAKELGFSPCSLIKNIPSKSQPWKIPVAVWIGQIYSKRCGDSHHVQTKPGQPKHNSQNATVKDASEDDLLAQYDTATGEPYFARASDGAVYTLEEAGRYFEERDKGR